jgi:quercetin dioxygenase-like cupin family protein
MTKDSEYEIIREEISPGRKREIAHLNNLMVVVFDFDDGPMKDPERPHSHPHEQITYVADGELLFYKGDDKFHLVPGDLITIPSGTAHSIQTLSKRVRLVDSFSPVRTDFIKTNK